MTAKTLRDALVRQTDRTSYLMTDEAPVYVGIGREFSGHGTINHSADEYVRGSFWHTNTAESFFAPLKRGIYGNFHHVSEAHLHHYLAEADFKYNTRHASDTERGEELLRGVLAASPSRLLLSLTALPLGARLRGSFQ